LKNVGKTSDPLPSTGCFFAKPVSPLACLDGAPQSRNFPCSGCRSFDQIKPGEIYEVVITNFLGGTFIRYRVGDLIRVTALKDAENGIGLPRRSGSPETAPDQPLRRDDYAAVAD
jgi:hypothetical protein